MRCKYPGPAAGSVPGTQTRSIDKGAVAGAGQRQASPGAGQTGEGWRVSLALDAGLPISDAEVRLLLFWMGDCLGEPAKPRGDRGYGAVEPAELDMDDDEDAGSPLTV